MITHEQLIFTIRAIYPQITESDHGRKYWVGMPVAGDQQTGDAFIAEDRDPIIDDEGEISGWGSNKLWMFEDIEQPTPEQMTAKWAEPGVQEGYAESIKPLPKTQFSVREFRERFTKDEQIAIRAASMTDMEVGIVYDDFQTAQFIDITDPAVAAGIDLYITKGLLEPHRKAELLTPQPIE